MFCKLLSNDTKNLEMEHVPGAWSPAHAGSNWIPVMELDQNLGTPLPLVVLEIFIPRGEGEVRIRAKFEWKNVEHDWEAHVNKSSFQSPEYRLAKPISSGTCGTHAEEVIRDLHRFFESHLMKQFACSSRSRYFSRNTGTKGPTHSFLAPDTNELMNFIKIKQSCLFRSISYRFQTSELHRRTI